MQPSSGSSFTPSGLDGDTDTDADADADGDGERVASGVGVWAATGVCVVTTPVGVAGRTPSARCSRIGTATPAVTARVIATAVRAATREPLPAGALRRGPAAVGAGGIGAGSLGAADGGGLGGPQSGLAVRRTRRGVLAREAAVGWGPGAGEAAGTGSGLPVAAAPDGIRTGRARSRRARRRWDNRGRAHAATGRAPGR
jgi:hypothetical protein